MGSYKHLDEYGIGELNETGSGRNRFRKKLEL